MNKTSKLTNDPVSVTVCPKLGDPMSHEGQKLQRTYSAIINTPLEVSPLKREISEISAHLTTKFPWAIDALHLVLGEIAQKIAFGNPRLSSVLKPFLLVGPPGCGKTKFATELCKTLDLSMDLLPGSASDTGGLQAVSRGWSSALPCGPVVAMHRYQCANPVLLIDEIDKAKDAMNNGHIWTTLLSMLNGDGHYFDSCLMSNVDLRYVNFWATANDIHELPRPLLDRFVIVQIPSPGIEHAEDIIDSIVIDYLSHLGAKNTPELPTLMRQKIAKILSSDKGSIRKMQQTYAAWLRSQALEKVLPDMNNKEDKKTDFSNWPDFTTRVH